VTTDLDGQAVDVAIADALQRHGPPPQRFVAISPKWDQWRRSVALDICRTGVNHTPDVEVTQVPCEPCTALVTAVVEAPQRDAEAVAEGLDRLAQWISAREAARRIEDPNGKTSELFHLAVDLASRAAHIAAYLAAPIPGR
jgi:hypothetical protein